MRHFFGGLAVAAILVVAMLGAWLFARSIESFFGLPSDWQWRLTSGVLFVGVVYLLWQVDNLKRDVRGLSREVGRLTTLIARSGQR